MSTDRLAAISSSKEGTGSGVTLDLIRLQIRETLGLLNDQGFGSPTISTQTLNSVSKRRNQP